MPERRVQFRSQEVEQRFGIHGMGRSRGESLR
jgi:hypothetical protein